MSILVTKLNHTDINSGAWSALTSTDGWVRIVNHGPCPLHVFQAINPGSEPLGDLPEFIGIFVQPEESVLVPSDDGTSGSRIGMYCVGDSFVDSSLQIVTVIANGG